MAEPIFPDGLGDEHVGRRPGMTRHAGLVSLLVLGALMLAALSGRLGGARSEWRQAEAPAAVLAVHMPVTLRNGLFFETRIRIEAHRDIAEPTLVIPASLWRDMTINTQMPEAKEQSFEGGGFRFTYDALNAGETLELKFDGQINPPLFAGNAGTIALLDGDRPLADLPLRLTVLP